jgi:hypothetical protein
MFGMWSLNPGERIYVGLAVSVPEIFGLVLDLCQERVMREVSADTDVLP